MGALSLCPPVPPHKTQEPKENSLMAACESHRSDFCTYRAQTIPGRLLSFRKAGKAWCAEGHLGRKPKERATLMIPVIRVNKEGRLGCFCPESVDRNESFSCFQLKKKQLLVIILAKFEKRPIFIYIFFIVIYFYFYFCALPIPLVACGKEIAAMDVVSEK